MTRSFSLGLLLRDLINFLEQSRIVVPAYTTLQRLIEHATSQERARLEALIARHLSDEQKLLLDRLLEDRLPNFKISLPLFLTCLLFV